MPTPQEMFKQAVARGMAASPFASTTAAPLILITSAGRKTLVGCTIEEGDNKAHSEEWGVAQVHTIAAHIPKTILSTAPSLTHDALEYQGRRYTLLSVSGQAAHSPVWVVEGSSPLKS
jgi:hypothetical protein